MGAYIINVPDTVDTIIYVNIGDVYDGKTYIASQRVEDLTPYTEPDLEQVRKEAYEEGYKTAKVQCNIQAEKDMREVGERHYQCGLSDAWDAARKIVLPGDVSGIYLADLEEIFDRSSLQDVIKDYSASECIEKIRQYEQEKEEQDGLRQNIQTIVDQCGYSLDEIATVLQKMKES